MRPNELVLKWASRLRSFGEDRGNVAVMSALMATVIFMFTAFGVDEASVYFDKRTLQGNADVAAIVAANNLAKAQVAANMSLQDNNVLPPPSSTPGSGSDSYIDTATPQVVVETGRYSPDPAVTTDQRFKSGASNSNAARVTVQKTSRLFFASFFATPPVVQVSAVARKEALASFSVGSRLASLNGGILNQILSGVLGTNISLNVMDYNALLSARVDVLPLLDAIGVKLGVTAGTYDSLLANSISYSDLARQLSAVNSLPTSTSGILNSIAGQTASSNVKVPLSQLFDLGDVGNLLVGQPHNAVQLSASVLDMLNAGALLGGQHQVQVNLGASIPGLAQTSFNLSIGEPAQNSGWLTMGEAGTMVYTAQTRMSLVAQVGGTGLLSGLMIRLPVYLDVARAQAQLESVQCSNTGASADSVQLGVQPGIAGLWIGDVSTAAMNDLSSDVVVNPATLINASLLRVTGSSYVAIGNQSPTDVTFSTSDITSHAVKTVSTSNFTSSLTNSLLGNLNLTVNAMGLSLNAGSVTAALKGTLTPLTPTIDQVIYNTLALAGVKVGQADVWINGTDCASAVLVQ